MSERKLDEIESMFQKTKQPKLEIETVTKPEKFGVLIDDSVQGKIALDIATQLASKLKIPIDVVISDEYHNQINELLESTKQELNMLKILVQQKLDESNTYGKIEVVLKKKIDEILKIFKDEEIEDEKLSDLLINKLEEQASDIFFLGVPVFRSKEEKDSEDLGLYATKLLRARRIHSNFLLVSDETVLAENDSILSFVSIEQQPGSIVALTRRALSIADENTEIKTVGLIEDKVIETLARVEHMGTDEVDEEGNDILNIDGAREKLEHKMDETLASIKIHEDIPHKSFSYEVKHGSVTGIVSTALEDKKPSLVLVRSVAEITENLDPIAEQVTRIVLRAGYPVLVVWD